MPKPVGKPVTLQIVENVEATLGAISANAEYYTNVRKVVEWDQRSLNVSAAPMVAVVVEGSSYDNASVQNVGEITDQLALRIHLILDASTDTRDKLLEFERDAKKALLADIHRDSLAVNTELVSADHFIPEDRDAVAHADLRIRVTYRTPRTDFNSAT